MFRADGRRFASTPVQMLEAAGPMDATVARRAVKWAAMARLSNQTLQLISIVALARLLSPSDFGLAAAVMSVTLLAGLFSDLGLGSAIIQLPKPSEDDLAAAFWVNALSGFLLGGLTWALARPIANGLDKPAIAHLLPLGGLVFALSLTTVQQSVLERTLHFRAVAVIEVLSLSVGTTAAIVGASLGMGASAIVLGPVVTSGVGTICFWIRLPYRPLLRVKSSSLRVLWARGAGVTGFNILIVIAGNIDNILLSKYSTATDTGFYSRSYQLMSAPLSQVAFAVNRVLFPTLARATSREALQRAYIRVSLLVCCVTWPITIALACLSRDLIPALLGDRWRGMVAMLAVMSAAGPAQMMSATIRPLYEALGESWRLFRLGVGTAIVTVVAFVIALPWHGIGLASAFCILSYAGVPFFLRRVFKLTGVRPRALLQPLAVPALGLLTMAGAMLAISYGLSFNPWIKIFLEIAAGIGLYSLIVMALAGEQLKGSLALIRRSRSAPSQAEG